MRRYLFIVALLVGLAASADAHLTPGRPGVNQGQMFPPGSNVPMGGHTFTQTAPATAVGMPLVGGANNTVSGTQIGSTKITGNGATFDNTVSPPVLNGVNVNNVINATTYGAKGDLIYSGDGAGHNPDGTCNGTTTFSSATGGFTSALIGDYVIIDLGATFYEGRILTVNSPTSLGLNNNCLPVTNAVWRIGFDNTSAFETALFAVPNKTGTIFLPAGRYLTINPVTIDAAHCNVTFEGDRSGTILMPYFSGDGYAFVDPLVEFPHQCTGGIRNVTFQNVGSAPVNQNLVRVSNEQGITISDMRANLYNATGDSAVYLDPGNGPDFSAGCTTAAPCTWTEQTLIRNLTNWFTTNMVTFAGKGLTSFSVNNNTITESHCDPTNGGSCIRLSNWGGNGALLNSHFDFNADLNGSGLNLISSDHRADDVNGLVTFNVRSQSLTDGTACFSAPANTGTWYVTGSVFCGDITQERNNNQIAYTPTLSGGFNINSAVTPSVVSNCGTSPTIVTGSNANAGEIIAGVGATACTLTFPANLGGNDMHCAAVADGQPLQLWTNASKGRNTNTFTCRSIASGNANCTSGSYFSYGCTGF
jgi:hypothetical protein